MMVKKNFFLNEVVSVSLVARLNFRTLINITSFPKIIRFRIDIPTLKIKPRTELSGIAASLYLPMNEMLIRERENT